MLQTAYWPCPPVCFTWRPSPFALPRIVSRYAIFAGAVADLDAELRLQAARSARRGAPRPCRTSRSRGSPRSGPPGTMGSSSRRRASPVASLSSSPFVFGAIAYASSGSGSSTGGSCTGSSFVDQRVAGVGLLQLRHRADIAGDHLGHRVVLLAPQREQLADAFVDGLRGVVHVGVRAHRPAEDAEHRDVPDERVGHRLEHERRERPGRVARALRLVRRPCRRRRSARGRAATGTPRR